MLEKTVHELYHANLYSIPDMCPNVHIGDYARLCEKYGTYMSSSELDMYIKQGADPSIIGTYIKEQTGYDTQEKIQT